MDLVEEIDVYVNNITWQQLLNNNQITKHLNTYDLSQLVSRVFSNVILLQFPMERFEHDISNNLAVEVFSEEPSELTFFKSNDTTQQLNIRLRDDSMIFPHKNDPSLPYQGWVESKNVTCSHISDCIGVFTNTHENPAKRALVLTPISSVLQLRPSFNLHNKPDSWKRKRVCQPESPEANEILKLLKISQSDTLYFRNCFKDYLDVITKKPGKSFPYNSLCISKLTLSNQLFLLFSEFEIVSNELISQYLTLDPYNPANTNAIDELLEIADLIDGNWVLKSKFCFTQLEDHQAHYLRLCRDLLLSLLYRQSQQISKSAAGGLTIEPFQKATGLPIEFVQYLVKRVAIQISSCWYLPYPRDNKFIKLNQGLAVKFQMYWTNRLSESAIEIQKLNQNEFNLDDTCCAIICYLEHSAPKNMEEIVNMLRNRGSYMLNIQHDKETWLESVKNVAINLGNDCWFLRHNKLNNFIASREPLLRFIASCNDSKKTFTKEELEKVTGVLPNIVFRRIVSEFMSYSGTFYHLKPGTTVVKLEIE